MRREEKEKEGTHLFLHRMWSPPWWLILSLVSRLPEKAESTNRSSSCRTGRPVMDNRSTRPLFVGPHEGREVELMRAGLKPASMFVEPTDSDVECFDEEEFDALVSEGKIVKSVTLETHDRHNMRRVIYALPHEEWRINALIFVITLYFSLTPGWHADIDRVIGLLLGYDRTDIEMYINWIAERHQLEL